MAAGRGRTLVGIGLAMAIGASLAVVTPGDLVARANAGGFILNGSRFGANASVMIDIGSLTRDCDTFETASSIYVVPTGTVGPGSALTDVSGAPNVLQSALFGGAVFDEIVAFTAPGGTVGAGTYDIVEDTCQNAIFDGSDSILRNAFTVTIPTGVPPLPSGAIAAMKSSASSQATYWLQAAAGYAALLTAYMTYSLVSDALDPVGFYLTYICSIPNLLPTIPDSPITPWCPTVSIQDTLMLMRAAVKSIVDKAAHYSGIAADPPDPNFSNPVVLGPVDQFSSPTGDPFERALVRWANTVGEGEALTAAFLASLEKYQGAEQAEQPAAALMHAEAIRSSAIALNQVLFDQSVAVDALWDALDASGLDLDSARETLEQEQARVAAEGLRADEVRQLRNLGFSAEAITDFGRLFVDEVELSNPAGNFRAMFSEQMRLNNAMGGAFVGIANGMNANIDALEVAVAVTGATAHPVADAGGPYNGAARAPISLTATCDACASFAWDLDGDGEFDDAPTATAAPTFTRSGTHLVSVRVTNAAGLAAVDHARVTIVDANGTPVVTAAEPAPDEPVEVALGSTRTFSVVATDPDGDELTYEWLLDGVAVAAGPEYTFTAAPGSVDDVLGMQVRVSDPAGHTRRVSWLIAVARPDADGDGWTANVDCDDTDAAVHPTATEVPRNGKDDDCDPATPDAGPPLVSFTVAPAQVLVGARVEFTDTSVDDSVVVAWSWDLDGDGTTDSSVRNPSFVYAAPGTYQVTLRATDDDGETATARRDVEVLQPPTPAFDSSPLIPAPGEVVQFTDRSTDDGTIVLVEWDFDHDGVAFSRDAVGAAPTHTFTAPGRFDVALRITDDDGLVRVSVVTVRVAGPPTAAFGTTPAPAIVGEPVTFQDASTDADGTIVDHAWDFDDDGVTDSNARETTHTFTIVGVHPVSLTVRDDSGNSARVTNDVVVTDRPIASFTFDPAAPGEGDAVSFTSSASDADGIASYEWDFDHDGATFTVDSTDANPTRAFTTASTVALRVVDTLGAPSLTVTRTVPVHGPPVALFNPRPSNGGTDVALIEHGATLHSASSQWNTTNTPREMIDIDYPANVPWLTGDRQITNQWAKVGLAGGRTYLIDRIFLRSNQAAGSRPRNFGISVSTTGTADAAFTPVLTRTLADNPVLQEFVLPSPAFAQAIRYDMFDNRGYARYIATDELRVMTGQVGTATVTFNDLSTDPDGDIVSWAWDFGDGNTSTLRNPTHTFAGPGDHTVTLTVVDAAGRSATRSLVQTVVTPPAPNFTFPAVVNEGTNATFTDTTVRTDRGIVDRRWQWGHGGDTTATPAPQHSFPDNGTYDVTLTVTDTFGQTASVTKPVTVQNLPATVDAGAGATTFVGQSWTSNGSVTDPGSTDRATLHCRWDYGDGTVVQVPACTTSKVRLTHTYIAPGTYTARLTTTDKDGGTSSDTATINVLRRNTYLNVYPVPGTTSGSDVHVRAKLWDRETWKPMPGHPVTLTLGAETLTLTTDAAGEVAAAMTMPVGGGTLTGTFSQSVGHNASSDADAVDARQLPPGDIVFMIDESGSMGGYQAAVKANVISISNQLAAAIDYQIGLMGFGAGSDHSLPDRGGHLPHLHVPPTDNLADFAAAANRLSTAGGTEPGINAIVDSLSPDTGLRDDVGVCLVLIADEGVQQANGVTIEHARQALAARGAVLFSVITPGTASKGYQDLAIESGGAVFDIRTFDDNPTPVLDALLDSCVTNIVQRPDIETSLDDRRTTVSPGQSVEYTVEIRNSGQGNATGVAVEVELPTGVTLVSSADGGSAAGSTITWPPFDLVAGARATRTFVVRIGDGAGGTVTIAAEAHDDGRNGADLTPSNNRDTDVDAVLAAAPALTVVTDVRNDAGGAASAADFTVEVRDGAGAVGSAPGDSAGTRHVLAPGGHSVAVSGPDGYLATYTDDCAPSGELELEFGDDVTCRIVLDDIAPTLTVVTSVRNDAGGAAVAGDFTVAVRDAASVVGSAAGDAAGTEYVLSAGAHSVGVTGPAGYATTYEAGCTPGGEVVLALGDDVTCRVVLDDIAPTLTVSLSVVNTGGGTATPADFRATIDGAPVTLGTPTATTAGHHTVEVVAPAGYAVSLAGPDCTPTGAADLDLGESATCAATATYQPPDRDGDGTPDGTDNCPDVANPGQTDGNGDGQGDLCEPYSYPAGGAFVIGAGADHRAGSTVMFWGAKWNATNGFGTGGVPSFKGFQNGSSATLRCGGTWTSRPGNSGHPPKTVPEQMAVVVTNDVVKRGSVITGDIASIVIVRTEPGYGGSPGHAGFGEVIAVLCTS